MKIAYLLMMSILRRIAKLIRVVVLVIWIHGTVGAQEWKPERTFLLPPELTEISALTEAGEGRVACLQDEDGLLFILDLKKGEIVQKVRFGPSGDYEGLTSTGPDQFWVLRSDGVLLELERDGQEMFRSTEYPLKLNNHNNVEGLAHDPDGRRLLLAPKDKDKTDKDRRHLFAFDLESKALLEKPLVTMSVNEIVSQARALGLEIPQKVTKKGRQKDALKLRFSAVAVRPGSHDLVLLSSTEPCLLTLSPDGRVKNLQQLDSRLLPKAEGLLFLSEDELLIASEGKDLEQGILQTFQWSVESNPVSVKESEPAVRITPAPNLVDSVGEEVPAEIPSYVLSCCIAIIVLVLFVLRRGRE